MKIKTITPILISLLLLALLIKSEYKLNVLKSKNLNLSKEVSSIRSLAKNDSLFTNIKEITYRYIEKGDVGNSRNKLKYIKENHPFHYDWMNGDSLLNIINNLSEIEYRKTMSLDFQKYSKIVSKASYRQKVNIVEGLKFDYIKVVDVYSVSSSDFHSVHFVAALLSNNKVGLWAMTGSYYEPELTLSVNSEALEYSVFPEGKNSLASSISDDGAYEVLRYMELKRDLGIKD